MSILLAADVLPMRADELLSVADVCSKGEFRRLVEQGGVSFNDTKVTETTAMVTLDDFLDRRVMLVRKGKRKTILAICAIMTAEQIEETKELARVAQPG